MSTATEGRSREYKVRDDLIGHGWLLVARAAGSKGAADLVMVHPDRGLALIQVGTPHKSLGPADRTRLVDMADLCSALPILATVPFRQPTRYYQVTRSIPGAWPEWSPAA